MQLPTLHPFPPALSASRAAIPARNSAEIDRRWRAATLANPRLHDSPILCVHALDAATRLLSLAHDSYKHFAIQSPDFDLGLRLLGVKGLLIGHDQHHTPHILLARRGPQTRIYGGLWEIAPAGGVSPDALTDPPDSAAPFVTTLVREATEELALTLDPRAARPVAFVEDNTARSIDVIVRCDLAAPIDSAHPPATVSGAHAWEYSATRWLPLATATSPPFLAATADETVPVALAVLHWLGSSA